jgi:hypothetical protein
MQRIRISNGRFREPSIYRLGGGESITRALREKIALCYGFLGLDQGVRGRI